ncbi:MAG: methylated-DNA--[protein]-cysteine S-methyltransferase [Pirellulales bacterium]
MRDKVRYMADPLSGRQVALFPTQLGWMACQWCAGRLEKNWFGEPSRRAIEQRWATGGEWITTRDSESELVELVARLTRYACEFADDFRDVPLEYASMGRFARRVSELCRQIPLGETRTYAELARQAGSPGAARAVGNTMARNPFPLVVPCHRVVAANGQLGGYSAPEGLTMKRRLLAAEARTHSSVLSS